MKQLLYIFLFTCSFFQVQSQVAVFKKTAQRTDDYLNNAWQGKDSFLFTYNNDTIKTGEHALQFSPNTNWQNWFRYTYTINAIGKVSTQIRENWVAGNWVNNTKYVYTYDGSGNVTEILYDVWNGGNWNPTGKIAYTGYNAYGKYQSEIVSGYSGGLYVNQTKRDRTYVNNDSLISSDEKFVWNNNNWGKFERLSYTYVQNEVSSITRLLPDLNANWAPEDKFIYNFNLSPFYLMEYIAQSFDTLTMTWQNLGRVTYNYNPDTLLNQTQSDNYVNNSWLPAERAQYNYNGNKEKVEYYTETFNGSWNKNTRSTYTYSNSFITQEEQFTGVGNNWQLSKKLSYTYDVNQNLTYELSENYNGNNFEPLAQAFYYYSSFTVNIDEKIKAFSKLILYPNPANDKINIQFDAEKNTHIQINILDLFGKTHVVMTQPVSTNQNLIQIPCATLSNGFYFAQIIDLQNNKQQIEKFQVQK